MVEEEPTAPAPRQLAWVRASSRAVRDSARRCSPQRRSTGQRGALQVSTRPGPCCTTSPATQQAAPEIEHRLVPVTGDRVEALVAGLAAERDLALVFVRTKRGA